jgi:biotin carboxyl carrier protein
MKVYNAITANKPGKIVEICFNDDFRAFTAKA